MSPSPRGRPGLATAPGLRAVRGDPDAVVLAEGDRAAVDGLSCSIDVYQAILVLADTALAIRKSDLTCRNLGNASRDGRQIAECAGFINLAIANTLFVMGLTSQAVSDCSGSTSVPAVCLAGVAGFLGNLEIVATASFHAASTCNAWLEETQPNTTTTTVVPRPTLGMSRPKPMSPLLPFPTTVVSTLQMLDADAQRRAEFQARMTACWVFTNMGPMLLIRAALILKDSVKWCSHQSIAAKGTKGERKCAVDIIGLLAALSIAARFISLSVPACADATMMNDPSVLKALCAAQAEGIVGAFLAAVATGSQFKDACLAKLPKDLSPDERNPQFFGFPRGRRLQDEEEAALRDLLESHFSREELELHGLWNASSAPPGTPAT